MGAVGGPGTSAPKIDIDVEFWSKQPQGEILRAIQNRSDWIQDHIHLLGPGNPNNISTALLLQRWREERRVLRSLIVPKVVHENLKPCRECLHYKPQEREEWKVISRCALTNLLTAEAREHDNPCAPQGLMFKAKESEFIADVFAPS